MLRRSRAREAVLQVLFQDDLNPSRDWADDEAFLQRRMLLPELSESARALAADPTSAPSEVARAEELVQRASELVEFARGLVAGVRRARPDLDARLARTADNWSLERMAATDRNILRLGAYEILYTQTPGPVAINEAVELAKRYGAAQSPQFVNGILDRFLIDREAR